ncbi:MAG: cytochrome c [Bdellovibrionaceae bacterium]|nr:cytochrome c [Pseudobdellovibrionaceae bacterium]MDW8190660.1 cytochrome c [Pseudobdellovibrionaceae bacterium]
MQFKRIFIIVVLLAGPFLVGCGASGNKPNVELIQDMMDQPAVKAQKGDGFFGENRPSSLLPPEHTRPRGVGKKAYQYKNQLDQALANLKNPFAGDGSVEVLLVGQKYYQTQCAVCHGDKGRGDGPLKSKYPMPIPSLLSDRVKGMKDSHIFHIISSGQGVMGSYASHIPEQQRWQVVNYIRKLQQEGVGSKSE